MPEGYVGTPDFDEGEEVSTPPGGFDPFGAIARGEDPQWLPPSAQIDYFEKNCGRGK